MTFSFWQQKDIEESWASILQDMVFSLHDNGEDIPEWVYERRKELDEKVKRGQYEIE